MPRRPFSQMNCAIAQTLDQVGEWWSLLILRNAFCGMTRFDDFKEHLGIATNILSARLDRLVRAGILKREKSPDDGRARDYRLTDKGLALYPVIVAMADWGERWAPNPRGPRIVFTEKLTGAPVERVAVQSVDGRILSPFDVKILAGRGADNKIRELVRGSWRKPRSRA